MKIKELFEKYWDNLIIGIVAGLVLYYGLKIQDGIIAGIYIFTISFILILLYTFLVWVGKKYKRDKTIKSLFNKKSFFNNLTWKEFFLICFAVFLAAAGGNFLFNENWILKISGASLLAISLFLEIYLLSKMDTREDVEKSKEEIEKLLKEARGIKEEVDNSHKDIDKINKSVFDVFSKNGFKNVEQRIKDLEDALKGNSSSFEFREFKKVMEDIKEVKRELSDLKRGFRR